MAAGNTHSPLCEEASLNPKNMDTVLICYDGLLLIPLNVNAGAGIWNC